MSLPLETCASDIGSTSERVGLLLQSRNISVASSSGFKVFFHPSGFRRQFQSKM